MIVRWISLDPPGIVHSHEPMKSSTQAPDSQPLEIGFCSTVCAGDAGDLGAEVGHPLQQLAVVQLHDRGVGRSDGARRRALDQAAAQRAQPGDLGLEAGQPILHDGIVDRPACRPGPGRCTPRPATGSPALPSRSASSSIVMPRSAPSVACATCPPGVLGADELGRGDDHVVEEDLAEVRLAGRLPDRADVDARRAHVHQEVRDAVALRRVGIGAGQQQAPVGVRGTAGPHLLAVDDVAAVDLAGRVVERLARSEPASGSEKPWHQISPSRIAGRWRRRCSSVPACEQRRRGVVDRDERQHEAGRVVRGELLVEHDLLAVDIPPPHSAGQCGTA